MSANFDKAIGFVLKHEGGYVDHPSDPGGETKYGISKRAYPDLDIKNITLEKAIEIYYNDYWIKSDCDKLEYPMCLVVFDTAVNLGVKRAAEIRKYAFNWTEYLFMRLAFYVSLNKPVFINGWVNRVVDLYKYVKGG